MELYSTNRLWTACTTEYSNGSHFGRIYVLGTYVTRQRRAFLYSTLCNELSRFIGLNKAKRFLNMSAAVCDSRKVRESLAKNVHV